jgi:hypothetical protein
MQLSAHTLLLHFQCRKFAQDNLADLKRNNNANANSQNVTQTLKINIVHCDKCGI